MEEKIKLRVLQSNLGVSIFVNFKFKLPLKHHDILVLEK